MIDYLLSSTPQVLSSILAGEFYDSTSVKRDVVVNMRSPAFLVEVCSSMVFPLSVLLHGIMYPTRLVAAQVRTSIFTLGQIS